MFHVSDKVLEFKLLKAELINANNEAKQFQTLLI